MSTQTNETLPDLFPQNQYHDARAGIAFLERAFGFGPAAIFASGDRVDHAEVRVGNGYVMTCSFSDATYQFAVPKDIGNATTGSVYIGTPDVEERYARAKAARAEIVKDLVDTDYGSRDFSARDPEGGLWHFGTYRPVAAGDDGSGSAAPRVYTGHRYRDARAAIALLEKAFGFEPGDVYGEGDTVAHAQLRFGNDIFMTGSARDDEYVMRTPQQLAGRYTQTICGYVDDPDRHAATARSAGVEILEAPADKPYGARVYVARDPEGYVWCFGTYRPGTLEAAEHLG